MADVPKSSNVTVITITFAVVIVVAMVCGMVMWIMQRTMAMNEKYIDARIAEAQLRAQAQAQVVTPPPAPAPAPQPEVKLAQAEALKPEVKPEPEAKPEPQPEVKPEPEVKPAPETKPAPKTVKKTRRTTKQKKPEVAKRKAPTETQEAATRVGEDGLPKDRINLTVGTDDLDWQL